MEKLTFVQGGRYIVKGGTSLVGSIEFYDRKTRKVGAYHPKATNTVNAGSDSPVALGNTPFVAGIGGFPNSSGNSIGVYDLRAEKNFRVLGRGQIEGRHLVASRDGRTLIATHRAGGVGFWDVKTGGLKWHWKNLGRGETAPQALAISPDNRQLATAHNYMNYGAQARSGTDAGHNPQIWSTKTGKLLVTCEKVNWKKLPQRGGSGWSQIYFTSLNFSPDGGLLATGSSGNGIVLWNVQSGKFVRAMSHPENRTGNSIIHMSNGGDAVFSPDSKRIAAPGNYGTIDVFSLSTGKLLRQIKGGGPLLWSKDGLFYRGLRSARKTEILTQIKL